MHETGAVSGPLTLDTSTNVYSPLHIDAGAAPAPSPPAASAEWDVGMIIVAPRSLCARPILCFAATTAVAVAVAAAAASIAVRLRSFGSPQLTSPHHQAAIARRSRRRCKRARNAIPGALPPRLWECL